MYADCKLLCLIQHIIKRIFFGKETISHGWAKIYTQSPGVTLIVLLFIANKYLLCYSAVCLMHCTMYILFNLCCKKSADMNFQ